MNFKGLMLSLRQPPPAATAADLVIEPRSPAATAVEQAALRRAMLGDELRSDTAAVTVVAGNLAARAADLRRRLERGEMDDAALVLAAVEAHRLRCLLETLEATL